MEKFCFEFCGKPVCISPYLNTKTKSVREYNFYRCFVNEDHLKPKLTFHGIRVADCAGL